MKININIELDSTLIGTDFGYEFEQTLQTLANEFHLHTFHQVKGTRHQIRNRGDLVGYIEFGD